MSETTETAKTGTGAKEPRQPLPHRDPQERAQDFQEVALGFALDAALAEARRCLQCKKPACVAGCPVGIAIPEFILALAGRAV